MTGSTTLPISNPDITGPCGKAWRFDVAGYRRRYPGGPPADLTVAAWAVHAPWAHPIWHSYFLGCISLRDMPGFPPAKINLPGATHEILLYALDPERPLVLDDHPSILTPVNFVGQFIEPSDAAARARIEARIREIVTGALNPDTDARRQWVERFSDSNLLPGALEGDKIKVMEDGSVIVQGTGAEMTTALSLVKSVNPDFEIVTPTKH